jgi:hypothetical protein
VETPKLNLLLMYSKYAFENTETHRKTEYESRKALIDLLLRTISTASMLLASGWVVLITGSQDVPMSRDILVACGLHIGVVAIATLTIFALIVAHTWSKNMFEELEGHCSRIYASSLIAEEVGGNTLISVHELHEKLVRERPGILKKWEWKINVANKIAWFLGSLGVALFVGSIVLDVLTGNSIVARRAAAQPAIATMPSAITDPEAPMPSKIKPPKKLKPMKSIPKTDGVH